MCGSEVQNFCYDEQNRLIWASNNATVPSAGKGTCGSAGYQSTLGGNYTNQYAYTNLGQLWKGPLNGGTTQEQYLYCDSAHPHQLSNLSQTASTPTCSSKGTVDYTGSYDNWGNTTSQVRGGIIGIVLEINGGEKCSDKGRERYYKGAYGLFSYFWDKFSDEY